MAPAPPPHFRRGAPMDRHQARRAAMVRRLAAGLEGDAVDYGCGWGDLTARLAPQFRTMVGLDTDAERVAFAAAEYAPIEFRHCAPNRLDCPDGSVDVVFSTVVLHFVADAADYLGECRRVLRPGGALVITIPNPESMWMLARRAIGRDVVQPGWLGSSLAEFRGLLSRHGFAVVVESGFYDPPFDRVRTAGDVVLSLMNGVGDGLGWARHSSYHGVLARRAA